MEVKDLDMHFLKITHAQIPPRKSHYVPAGMCYPSFKATAFRYDSARQLPQSVTETCYPRHHSVFVLTSVCQGLTLF